MQRQEESGRVQVGRCQIVVEETFAARQLFQRDEFIGLVGMDDVAGAANHRRHAGFAKQAAFGAEADLARTFVAQDAQRRSDDGIVGRGAHAGVRGQGFEFDTALRAFDGHLRHHFLLRIGLHFLEYLMWVDARQEAVFEHELGLVGNDVGGIAAIGHRGDDGGVRHIEVIIPGFRIAHAHGDLADLQLHHRSEVDAVDAQVRTRRVRRVAVHRTAIGTLALVRDHGLHRSRLADDDAGRLDVVLPQVVQQPAYSQATDFLIIGERKMQRRMQAVLVDCGQARQADGDKTFHVAGATAEQLAVGNLGDEGIGIPVLPRDRHHIGMAGKYSAEAGLAVSGAGNGCKQVGLAAVGVVGQARPGAEALQVIAHPFDQAKVGFAADGIEADERLEDIQRLLRRFRSGCVERCIHDDVCLFNSARTRFPRPLVERRSVPPEIEMQRQS